MRRLRSAVGRWRAGLVELARGDGSDRLPPTMYGFILRHSLRDQILLVVLTLLSFPVLYYSLELPKTIINRAIAGKGIPKGFPKTVLGVELDQLQYLAVLCAAFLALVVINGWFKFYINVHKGQLGERMLRRLRYELYQRVLRFPMPQFNRTSSGEIIAMITAELEPLGEFIGDAFSLPAMQGGTLLTILMFMFMQDPALGAAAIALYPIQAYVIPRLQRRVRMLGRERVRTIRRLSDRIGESIAGRVEIRTNDGAPYQLADIADRLGQIYDIRFEIYNRKFFVKFLNNFIGQLTPFFFYAIGGYLVIQGSLSFGALVAVLAAYKELSSPWRELLDFYQQQQDVSIKYEQVIEQFQVPRMVDRHQLLEREAEDVAFAGTIAVQQVSLRDQDGLSLLEEVSVSFELGEHVAIVGDSKSGKNILAQLLARILSPTSGRITVSGHDLESLPFAITGRHIGYVGPTCFVFAVSLRDNLLLGLRHHPRRETDQADLEAAGRARARWEAYQSGNTELDVHADWIDYAQAGVSDAAELEARILEVLRLVDLVDDVYLFGLHGRLDPATQGETVAALLEARRLLQARLADAGLEDAVERFDPARYIANASIADNLLFGKPVGAVFGPDGLARHDYLLRVLDRVGLTDDLVQIGHQVAETMVELFADFSADNSLAEAYSLVEPEQLPAIKSMLGRLSKDALELLAFDDRATLLAIALKLVLARHRLGLIDEQIQRRILEARRIFAAELPEPLQGAVEFFDPERYNAAALVQENLLFGTLTGGEAARRERVFEILETVLGELGLRETLIRIGLDYWAGTAGARLSLAQRQKLGIARAVLKRPDLLVLIEATAALDEPTQLALLDRLRQEFAGRSLVWSLHRANQARAFDRTLLMEQGRLVADGDYDELERTAAPIARLAAE